MPEYLIDLLGWVGAFCLLFAYWLISIEKIGSRTITYQSINLFGCALLTINSAYYHAFPSAALNLLWGVIGLSALASIILFNRKPENKNEHN